MTDIECCREEEETNSMNYWCSACDQKHASNGSEVYTPCCNCAMCETSFHKRLQQISVVCPSCSKEIPTLMTLNDSNQQLNPLSRPAHAALASFFFGCSMASWAIAPGLPLAILGGILYMTLNLLNFCMAISYGSAGFCFDSMPALRMWVTEIHSSFSYSIIEPVSVLLIAAILVVLTLFVWVTWSLQIRPRIEKKIKTILQRRFSLYMIGKVFYL